MILAVPAVILVAFFLGWLLVKLTVHALPLSAGVCAALFVSHAGGGIIVPLMVGPLVGIAVAATGRIPFERCGSPAARLGIPLTFAAPASIAAYHAAFGLSSAVPMSGTWHAVIAVLSGLPVGAAAWRAIVSGRAGERR